MVQILSALIKLIGYEQEGGPASYLFFFFYFKHVLFERDNCAQQILFLTLLIYSEIQ